MDYYRHQARNFPWRETTNPYHILVSEFMLQQTQVERVQVKYPPFIKRFPDMQSIARASLKDILAFWQGLGYNRRALNLWQTAHAVMAEHNGMVPESLDGLIRLPGIGSATSGAIITFSFNRPAVFIETNIRRTFIHFFFHDRKNIHDKEIMPLVEATLDYENPRHWYYALMDYGAMLKKKIANPNQRSLHYTKQSPFAGSDRQIRGGILKLLLDKEHMVEQDLLNHLEIDLVRARAIMSGLEKEGFLVIDEGEVRLG